jgi:hypothetical protein
MNKMAEGPSTYKQDSVATVTSGEKLKFEMPMDVLIGYVNLKGKDDLQHIFGPCIGQ